MNGPSQKIEECKTAAEALESLCQWFYEDRISGEGCEPILAAELPEAYRNLLVHNDHMTRRLAEYHGAQPRLKVLHERTESDIYSRNILLICGDAEQIIEFGIVRIAMHFVPEKMREAILDRERPLGDILMTHGVLRRIEPRWYFRFEEGSPMEGYFGRNHRGEVFGRVGTIYCDGQPAIELLEVVTDVRAGESQ